MKVLIVQKKKVEDVFITVDGKECSLEIAKERSHYMDLIEHNGSEADYSIRDLASFKTLKKECSDFEVWQYAKKGLKKYLPEAFAEEVIEELEDSFSWTALGAPDMKSLVNKVKRLGYNATFHVDNTVEFTPRG